jgi:hypothetical protein
MPDTPPPPNLPDRLTESEMRAIVRRRQEAARLGLDSYPAMRQHVFRQAATREADDRAMLAEFEAVLADVLPETAARSPPCWACWPSSAMRATGLS